MCLADYSNVSLARYEDVEKNTGRGGLFLLALLVVAVALALLFVRFNANKGIKTTVGAPAPLLCRRNHSCTHHLFSHTHGRR